MYILLESFLVKDIMVILALLLLYLVATDGFYISLNRLDWYQAESYCIQHCNSHLVSLHSYNEHQQLIRAIHLSTTNNTMINMEPSARHIYIGLSTDASDQWQWTDGTSFTFGKTGGVYPWNSAHPSSNSSFSCVIVDRTSNLWYTTTCTQTDAIFACNSCDESLTKYSIITDTHPRSGQSFLCSFLYGTELMSMHSHRDFDEASMVCSIIPLTVSCYVGLTYYTSHSYQWDDLTTFDYASSIGSYPWVAVPDYANNNCTHIAKDLAYNKYVLSDTLCTASQYGLCNLPSETCYSKIWTAISGSAWTFTTNPCAIRNDNRHIDQGTAIITSKQWNNNGHNLVFEYIYTMDQTQTDTGTAGVAWYVNGTCSPYYYIGISIETDAVVFLAHVVNNDITYIDTRPLPFEYKIGTFYILRGEISASNTFTVSINDHILFLNKEGHRLFDDMDTSIGFLGIMNTRSSIIAKSLFVSGEMEVNVPSNIAQWLLHCPSSSIIDTTKPNTDDADGTDLFAALPLSSIIGIGAVVLILCFLSCCVICTIYRIRTQKQEIDSTHPTHDPEEIVNIQMNAQPKRPQSAVVSVSPVARAPPPVDKQQNMANEFERALVAAWLENDVGLPQYYKLFIRNGYESMHIIKEIGDRAQLTEIGIGLLGHQTMIMSEIQRYNIQSHVNITDKGKAKDGNDTWFAGLGGVDGNQDTGWPMARMTFGSYTETPDPAREEPGGHPQPRAQPGRLDPDPMSGIADKPLPEEGEFESGVNRVDSSMRSSFGDDLFGTYIQ
eukprot:235348_1